MHGMHEHILNESNGLGECLNPRNLAIYMISTTKNLRNAYNIATNEAMKR
jgi:hypothetical protein